jgi:hypothetical protein
VAEGKLNSQECVEKRNEYRRRCQYLLALWSEGDDPDQLSEAERGRIWQAINEIHELGAQLANLGCLHWGNHLDAG